MGTDFWTGRVILSLSHTGRDNKLIVKKVSKMNKKAPFLTDITVRGYELDAFNHVNHAVYLNYFEHARWMAMKKIGLQELSDAGLSFIVRKASVDYLKPAHVFDELVISLWIEKVGRTSLTFGQEVLRKHGHDQQVLAVGEVVAVCIDAAGRPHPVPQTWIDAAQFGQDPEENKQEE